jgi:hypothetical protein
MVWVVARALSDNFMLECSRSYSLSLPMTGAGEPLSQAPYPAANVVALITRLLERSLALW